ncbi:SpoIID/LytB domain-containing protein [Prochlorococcus marinus]|uniref:SpoIID/LytB domain-containing protein n=1 Tax=Prochlorococcus marinus TaxID=1219 RepID=UPI0018C86215|nr:SpoIID/LytB domain-containing protein [Prochlorococcus marinus]
MMGVCGGEALVKTFHRSLLRSKQVISGALVLLGVCTVGCDAQEVIPPVGSVGMPTHQAVQAPPVPLSGRSLWVALQPYLGQGTTSSRSAPSLRLISAGHQPLLLQDARGDVQRAPVITISWRLVALDEPLQLSRQVAGPFASFESAEQVASQWRELGVAAVVAHPSEWEVWAPQGVQPLPGVDIRLWQGIVSTAVQPVIQGDSGDRSLVGPIQIDAPDGLSWKGGVYLGPFQLQVDAYGSWTLVEHVPLERYLEGVVPHEIGAGAPSAALAAQTVLARTWALANSHRFALDGYHLCSDTQCQVYSDPRQASFGVRQAIVSTAGKVLSWKEQPINAVYHASNGGVMAAGSEAWSMESVPYLRAQLDGSVGWVDRFLLPLTERVVVKSLLDNADGAYGQGHPRFRWTRTLTAEQLKQALRLVAPSLSMPKRLTVLERGPSGRVLSLEIRDEGHQPPVVLRLDGIRRHLRQLPSTLFVVEEVGVGVWQLSGGGFGHGAGLSQAGAVDLARRGWTTEQILSHYYPGTTYGPLPEMKDAP